jgi:hypothetical protein
MTRIVPIIPLGPYPHAALCGQDGTAPTSNKIRTTNNTVPNIEPPIKFVKPIYGNKLII